MIDAANRDLLNLLDIEQLEVDLFRGTGAGGETPKRIFGGQVIAQALMAAYRTVEDRLCHSLHAYFIRPGDPSIPVIYQVDRARDGGSFTTRRVVAIQHGRQILNLSASFQVEEDGWTHQHAMPDVPAPEELTPVQARREEAAARIPEKYREEFLRLRPIEICEVDPQDFFTPEPADDRNQVWFRVPGAAGTSPVMQHCLLAYASDLYLLGSSLRPHGLTWLQPRVMTASLDHAMWFHAPIAFENWHLYVMDSPKAAGGRGFNRGSIYTRDGNLVASTAQEGLVRPVAPRG
ncbi:acyl-CoA thioesterase [Marinibacterium profundimaris]|uniref:Acyl-CoA thioesterase 2 n=1 Tax=Marinibacterium profundimaris TaxID=1679460 RepID=A0A225NQT1_9RHOB|nr:acyl-CoA thioesterase II [Marinibacterium profundimaris]OWU77311.1 acyl-CoA thioesterase [Marinibacterium profundimaris]